MKPIWISIAVLFVLGAGILQADENTITIYQKNLGMVRQVRSMEFGKGLSEIHYSDIPSKIIPSSVLIRPLDGEPDLQVMEQTFVYDSLNFENLLKKYVKRPVTVIKADGESINGHLLNAQGGSIILKTDQGVRVLGWNNKMSIQLKDLPKDLFTKPTLIWLFNKSVTGKKNVEVTYLTKGMRWEAEYTGVLNETDSALLIKAWASIDNGSGKTFNHAKIKLIAGDIQQTPKPGLKRRIAKSRAAPMLESASPAMKEKEIFEYHAYELEKLTTLKTDQVKQVAMLAPTSVACEKKYYFNANRNPKSIEVRIHFKNNETAGLGKPLPAGIFRIYKKNGADLEFVGEDRIRHTPRNEKVRIAVGKAFDLTGERSVKERINVSKRSERQKVEIELSNSKKGEVTIIVEEAYYHRNWKIEDANFSYNLKDANRVEFEVPVNAGKKSILTYTVFMSW